MCLLLPSEKGGSPILVKHGVMLVKFGVMLVCRAIYPDEVKIYFSTPYIIACPQFNSFIYLCLPNEKAILHGETLLTSKSIINLPFNFNVNGY